MIPFQTNYVFINHNSETAYHDNYVALQRDGNNKFVFVMFLIYRAFDLVIRIDLRKIKLSIADILLALSIIDITLEEYVQN